MECIQDQYSSNTNKWANLPTDILTRILKHLNLKTDLTRLRGVCPSWRSALEKHPTYTSHIQLPCLGDGNDVPLFLQETTFFYFEPLISSEGSSSNSGGWVARMGQTQPNKWILLSPLPYHHWLPRYYKCMFTDPPIVGEINLLDCRVLELGKTATLVHELDYKAKPVSKKVVGEWDMTSTNPFSVILVHVDREYHNPRLSKSGSQEKNRLLFLRSIDEKWVTINLITQDGDYYFEVLDIAYHNHKFFVFQRFGRSWRVGIINPHDSIVSLKPFINGPSTQNISSVQMVPSLANGCLYLVIYSQPRYFGKDDVSLYFVNENDGVLVDESKWEAPKNLEDEILFYATHFSFSIKSSILLNATNKLQDKKSPISICEFSFKKVLIYYHISSKHVPVSFEYLSYKQHLKFYVKKEAVLPLKAVLEMKDNEPMHKDIVYYNEIPKEEREVYTRLFFPPPAWVKWRCPSLDNVEVTLDDIPFYDRDEDYDFDRDYDIWLWS